MESILTSIKKLLGIEEEYTQFDADIIDFDFNMDSEGPTSKVLFEDGTMKFYHKATAEDLAKIDTSVGDIK